MRRTMEAELEPLDSSSCTRASHHVFAFVQVRSLGGRQALALDWQKRVKLRVPSAFEKKGCTARLGRQINVSSRTPFVWDLCAELNPAPTVRNPRCTIQVIAELVGQGSLRGFLDPLGVVAPAGQFVRDEIEDRISGSPGQLDRWVESSRLPRDGGIRQHRVTGQKPCSHKSPRVSSASRRATDRSQ